MSVLRALLLLLLPDKLIMRVPERDWRQCGWEFRGSEDELEGSGESEDCGGLEM